MGLKLRFVFKCLGQNVLFNLVNWLGNLEKKETCHKSNWHCSCDMDRSYLGRIERGKVNPTLEKLYELAKSLDVNVKDLLPE